MLCYSWPCPQLWPLTPAEICHERELLNTKWSLVQESESERERCRQSGAEREGERAPPHTEEPFILSLSPHCSFFLPLLCFLFCFHCTETVALSSYASPLFLPAPPLPHPRLAAFGQQRAVISGHRHHRRYGFMAARTSGTPGGSRWDEALMRARPRQPERNVCKWYAHTKKDPG